MKRGGTSGGVETWLVIVAVRCGGCSTILEGRLNDLQYSWLSINVL